MLNRRYLRIKVMQALYGFFQSNVQDIAKGEKELFNNIDKIYDLYIYQLALLLELRHVATVQLEDAKKKRLPTAEDLDPNLKFLENKFITQLAENIHLKRDLVVCQSGPSTSMGTHCRMKTRHMHNDRSMVG